jgi:transcriptional regulator with XRE-family HTH domain
MMFDMKSIGRKIAMHRKEKNLTQMELADMLNISYQAVSNWERGETMPDISKLPEIAQIFNASIDDILGNQQSAKIIENIIKDNLIENIISVEDFKSVAPLLKPTQISEISNGVTPIDDINDMIDYLPFVSKEVADSIAQKSIENDQILLDDFLPFVSRVYAEKLVLKAIESNYAFKSLTDALPFVGREVADKIAQKGIENNQILLDDFLPFVSRVYAENLVLKAIENNYAFKDLTDILPFVSREVADKIVKTRF